MHDLETIQANHSQLTQVAMAKLISKDKKQEIKVKKFNKKSNE
jgi:hypothetical protein